MKMSWIMLMASEFGDGSPSSGSTPTSAAAWSCEEDAEKWGYAKKKEIDTPRPESKTSYDSGAGAYEGWRTVRADQGFRTFTEGQVRLESSVIA